MNLSQELCTNRSTCWCCVSGISSTSFGLLVGTGYSDDTELFIYDFAKAGDFRPKCFLYSLTLAVWLTLPCDGKEEYDPEFYLSSFVI